MSTGKQRKIEQAQQFLAESKVHSLFESITAELVQYKPNKPLEFMLRRWDEMCSQADADRAPPQSFRPNVVFVLGGPGSGKGTQCAQLVGEYGCVHLSAGDLLRKEVTSGTEQGQMIGKMIQDGQIVPGHVTIGLLEREIRARDPKLTFLVDGFPREMGQAVDFERDVCECAFVLFFSCSDDELEKRLLERGKTSGRSDDNKESIRKRLDTYHTQTRPVVDYYSALGKLRVVDAANPLEKVWESVKPLFK
eukprot:TRINITY_DN4124_c4_g1_i1.p1 TRINITY_DN4124_c4_g1~~TRINITY_DN4124_c4_g1_i1.p1  ORF type:complete len:250 (+),score=45.40 TRINITY_DN4124_c4_g1_i1:82-831(+)